MSSDLTARMVVDDLVVFMNKKPSRSSIETCSVEAVKRKTGGTSEIKFSGEKVRLKLDRVLHAPKIAQNLVLDTGLCDDGHIFLVTDNICVTRSQRNIVCVDRHTYRMYTMDFKKAGERYAFSAF